jgi:chemotaxis family two-component system sensor histidine kinase/response regulator PixL
MCRNILIVEDTDTAATALEIALTSIPNVSVTRVHDGLRALEYLAPDSGHTVHAVVTDVDMPFLDGLELVRRLRQEERFAVLPIVVVSGDTSPQASEIALRLGADAFFAKPWSAREVRKKIQDLLP